MGISAKWAAAFAVAVAFAIGACADPQQISEIKAKVDEIQAQQKDIIAKLEGLSQGQKQMLAKAPAAAAQRPPQEDPNKVYNVPIGKSPAKGPADAAVTVVEFSDFQCPFCAQAAALIKQVTDAYPNDVRFVYKNYPLPFHKDAMPAAKAAVAAGNQGKFFEMHDKLFENYRTLTEEVFIKSAQEIGLDVERFKKDMADPATQAMIDQDMKDAREADVRGTPTILINGKKPQGRSFELYKGIIDEAIKAKKAG